MRLKKLELFGFKSFVQRTEIVLNEGITAIVGPNGSGKSNIGDAVRWVLGEQSPKTLRGASMQDVIFSGTEKRKPLNYCEVSLTFDNEDKTLPMDYAEICVTRRVYRNGDSEYYLNRSACRLKDIVELFRDTGVGKEGYSIIGQGRIDEILSRKGEDRRLVFEEAAGIVKYRARKEEADKRLAHTRDNLSRVDDILDELNRRLVPLEEQAGNARQYLAMSAELKDLDLNLFLVRSDKMEAKLRELDSELQGMRAMLDRHETALMEKAEVRDRLQESVSALDERITAAHNALMEGMEAVHRAGDAVRETRERRGRREENRERIAGDKENAARRLEELEILLKDSEEGREKQTRLLAEREAELQSAGEAEEEARRAGEVLETELEARQTAMMEAMNRRAMALSNQTRLKTMLSTMGTRMEELGHALEGMEGERTEKEADLNRAREQLERETQRQTELERDHEALRAALARTDEAVIEARKTYDTKLAEMRDMESRQKILAEMSREMEGYSHSVRGAMRRARERNMHGVHGVVGQLLRVPKEFETAMDMVLGAAQQHIVTDDEETAKELIEYLRSNHLGRATFLPLSAVRGNRLNGKETEALKMPGCRGIAADLVECDPEFRPIVENLLGRTVVADTLAQGIAIMRRGNHAFRLVTLQGDVMHSGGSMTGGSVSSRNVNLFSRERELKELTEKLEAGQTGLESLLTALRDGQADKDRLKTEAAEALEALHQQEIAVARETERTRNAEAELGGAESRIAETGEAVEQLKESMARIEEQLAMASGESEEKEASREETEREIARLQKEVAEAKKTLEARSGETLRLTLEVSELRHGTENLTRDRSRLEQDRSRIQREQKDREEQLARMSREDEADRNTEEAQLRAEAEARETQNKREAIRNSLEEDRAEKQKALQAVLSDMEGIHQLQSRDTDRTHRLELNRARTDGDLKALQDRIWNTYQVTYAGAEEFRKEPFNVQEADRRAAQLSVEIRALGTVNVGAVEEYAETKTRYDDMMTQRQDLEKAETDIRDLIERLLDQMKATFVENFTLLQGYFSETFRRLFGGGQAELKLENPEDPLNCAIEINAQPPGKKLQLLSLLSGGERALTAIAILFATLKLKPTPFCILDEIEAALDDANIGYFADYLAEYSRETQFMVITHRKGTMERADSLYGVAMEEQGVSKMVSVSLKDYAAE